jgi:hypothetical protein
MIDREGSMATDPIREYLDARARLDNQTRLTEAVVKVVLDGANALREWRRALVANVSGGGFPAELVMNERSPTINGREWPSAQQIADALGAWHDAHWAMRSAWDRVPLELQGGLKPPQSK